MKEISQFFVNQIKEAGDAHLAVQELKEISTIKWDMGGAEYFLGLSSEEWKQELCLLSASATCVNLIAQRRLIGEYEGKLKVGDFFRYLLPHHGHYPSEKFPRGGWFVVDAGGVCHQAVTAFVNAIGISAIPFQNFSCLKDIKPIFENGGLAVISLDNTFVRKRNMNAGSSFLRPGRHAVSILGISDGEVSFADPFMLQGTENCEKVASLPIGIMDSYLRYTDGAMTRGIAFHKSPDFQLPIGLQKTPINIPTEVRDDLEEKLKEFQI